MKEKNGQLIITDIFVHLVSRWSPLILTVLTNQFIKIVNVTQSYLVQLQAEGSFLLPLYFAVVLLEVNTTVTKEKRARLRGGRWDLLAVDPHGFSVQNPKDIFIWLKACSGRDRVWSPRLPSSSAIPFWPLQRISSLHRLHGATGDIIQVTLEAGNQHGGFWFGIYRTQQGQTRWETAWLQCGTGRQGGRGKVWEGAGTLPLLFSFFISFCQRR